MSLKNLAILLHEAANLPVPASLPATREDAIHLAFGNIGNDCIIACTITADMVELSHRSANCRTISLYDAGPKFGVYGSGHEPSFLVPVHTSPEKLADLCLQAGYEPGVTLLLRQLGGNPDWADFLNYREPKKPE